MTVKDRIYFFFTQDINWTMECTAIHCRLFSAETVYMVSSTTGGKLCWSRGLSFEIINKQTIQSDNTLPTIFLFVDNKDPISISCQRRFTACTKNIGTKYHHVPNCSKLEIINYQLPLHTYKRPIGQSVHQGRKVPHLHPPYNALHVSSCLRRSTCYQRSTCKRNWIYFKIFPLWITLLSCHVLTRNGWMHERCNNRIK